MTRSVTTHSLVNYAELHDFARKAKSFLQDTIDEDDFVATRLQQGIYGQRQENKYMVRVKIPGGFLNVSQLDCLGGIIKEYSSIDFANITTRQDIQLHFVQIEDVPKVLLRLADSGLTTREACGNTVRNVTACSQTGQCEKDNVNVQSVVDDIVTHCLRHPVMQHLPRKFKMSVSGCEKDCAMGMIQDIGVIALQQGDVSGYKVRVAGGLGHKPRESFVLEEFVEKDQLLPVIESVILLHNKYSDRSKRARSRLKFLVDKFGQQEFKEKYRAILKKTQHRRDAKLATTDNESITESKRQVVRQPIKRQGSFEVSFAKGDISVENIQDIVNILRSFKGVTLQTLQNQNLLLSNVALSSLDLLKQAFIKYGFKLQDEAPKAVACPGSWTCRLGITSSRSLLEKVDQENLRLKVHVSGCHNGCAQPQIADIGLHGEARRLFGYLVPYYRLHLGGNAIGEGSLALKGPEIPAARVYDAIKRIEHSYFIDRNDAESFQTWVKRKELKYFTGLLEDFIFVTPDDLASLLKDVDQVNEFKVLQLGGGECAGIKEESIASKHAELAYEKTFLGVFTRQGQLNSALDCAEHLLTLTVDILLLGRKQKVSTSLSDACEKLEIVFEDEPLKVQKLLLTSKLLQTLKVSQSATEIKAFLEALEDKLDEIFLLQKAEVVKNDVEQIETIIDLRNLIEPMQFLKAKQALLKIREGDTLEFALTQNDGAELVVNGLQKNGYTIVTKQTSLEGCRIRVLKPYQSANATGQENKTVEVI